MRKIALEVLEGSAGSIQAYYKTQGTSTACIHASRALSFCVSSCPLVP